MTVTTDDGSTGTKGWVSDVLPDVIRRAGAAVVYGCGPMAMLKSITDVAAAEGAVAQVAVEESMACGVGVCMTCVMPVTGTDGRTRMVRSCVEGPVFRGDRVRWDAFWLGPGAGPRRRGRRAAEWRPLMSTAHAATATHAEPPGAPGRHAVGSAAHPAEPADDRLGCAANGRELRASSTSAELGAFVTKSVMADPRSGRGTPRMAETPSGMLNSIGLQGPGISAFVRDDLAWLKSVGARALVSIAGSSSGEYAEVAATLRAVRGLRHVVGVEVNISCPTSPTAAWCSRATRWPRPRSLALVREQLPRDIPIFAKLSPTSPTSSRSPACVKAGADGLT